MDEKWVETDFRSKYYSAQARDMVAEARVPPLRVGTSDIMTVTRTIINIYKILWNLHCTWLYSPSMNVYSSG